MANNPYTRQLERLRVEVLGIPTVQEFVTRLNARLAKPVPYATAARYHKDREPPATYLQAVARVFGVRPDWLLTGDGEPSEEHLAASEATRLAAEIRLLGDLNVGDAELDPARVPYWIAPLGEVALRLWVNDDEEDLDRKAAIRAAVRDPLRALGVDPARMERECPVEWANYVTTLTPALFILVEERARQRREAPLSIEGEEARREVEEADREVEAMLTAEDASDD